MSSKFEDFVDRVFANSHLEITGGKLTNAFLSEVIRDEKALNEFLESFKPLWEKWKKNQGKHLISPFIEAYGNQVLRKWLTEIYPFQYYSLRLSCKRGPSSVDAVMLVNYFYSQEEIKIIESKIKEYDLDYPAEEVCRILITNALKSIPQTISKIMEIDYKIMIEKLVNYNKTKQGFQIMVRAVGRIQ
ncbi:MAG: hypothetical protein ACTSPY_10110 [Candidatus Helarchaeota archaeon]